MSEHGHRSGRPHPLTLLAFLAVAVHLFGLYRSTGPPSPSWFPNADKLEHVVGFGAPVFLILLARLVVVRRAGSQRVSRRFTTAVVVAFLLHAVLSELIQHFFYVQRTGDPFDALADGTGVALGWAAAQLVTVRSIRGRTAKDDDGARMTR